MARPGYVAYRNVARALHLEPVEVPAGAETRFQLTAESLDALNPAPEAVIVASPANPTGTVIAPEGLAAIAEVCVRRKIRCISDEIYHGLTYGAPARSMLEFLPGAFVVNSFSKYFSMPGWRLGWLVAPEDRVERARACVGNLFLTPPSLSQHAALEAFEERDELEGHVRTYRRNRDLMLEALPQLGLGAIAPPDGAFYIYADVGRFTNDSLSLCKRLLMETGVATAPGVDFDPVDGGRFMRFSFAVSTPLVEDALGRLIPWFVKEGGRPGV
jgi:aspartate/methionine/tyrosine aminotransferase